MKKTRYGIKTKYGMYRLDSGVFYDEDLDYVIEHTEKTEGHIVWHEVTPEMYKVTLVMTEGENIVYGAESLTEVTDDVKVLEAALKENLLVRFPEVAEYPFWVNPKYLLKVEVAEGLD